MARWDNIDILRVIDRRQEEAGGAPPWISGAQLMEDVAGGQVHDEQLIRGFIQELHVAQDVGLLTFGIMRSLGIAPPNPDSNPRYYLEQLKDFALTPQGQDRARGRMVVRELPDPSEDDGRAISNLILGQVAEAIEAEYSSTQAVTFLSESGIPLEQLPLDTRPEGSGWVHHVLVTLDRWGSEGRRPLRRFLGRWLDDQLMMGPTNELRAKLVEQLARQGWYVVDGNLLVGEPSRGKRVSSPVLRDARLAALHPRVLEAAEKYVLSEHYGAAVFEAVKAVNNRVKEMSGRTEDGTALMSAVFSGEKPHLVLGDLNSQSGRNVQEGFRSLFVGAVQGIRNPPAHEPFEDLDLTEALEHLGLLSLLMRKLDTATPA